MFHMEKGSRNMFIITIIISAVYDAMKEKKKNDFYPVPLGQSWGHCLGVS